MPKFYYEARGFCPICEAATVFASRYEWLRDHLLCTRCRSIPRERAIAIVLNRLVPRWRDLAIHESSPAQRGISLKLARECARYIATHFFAAQPLGTTVNGFRNEDLEHQTFADESFDLVVSLDVMEHVNEPGAVFREVWRTLRYGGYYLFTTPTYKGLLASERRARYSANGQEVLVEPAEYHGNPISDQGSLVTFHYGYDLPELIASWACFDTTVFRFHDRRRGVLGEFTEVYLCEK